MGQLILYKSAESFIDPPEDVPLPWVCYIKIITNMESHAGRDNLAIGEE
jgi:hypothetical protein